MSNMRVHVTFSFDVEENASVVDLRKRLNAVKEFIHREVAVSHAVRVKKFAILMPKESR